jgi:DeoR/GlpR family transcriptional regulator of sugar metabolism
MLAPQRRSEIVRRVKHGGSVVAAELAAEWQVSEDTIRRDLRELAADGLLKRVYGGAVNASPAAADYATRTEVATEPKKAVATTAVGLIEPGQTIFLDGGTTTATMCRCLPPTVDLTVVTHSPTVALELIDHPTVQVLIIGGTLYRHSIVAVGATAAEYIATLNIDVFFMGVSGVHPTHGLTTGDAEEAAIKRTISQRAADTYVLASSEKLGSALSYRVVGFGDVTGAITDERNPKTLKALRQAGLAIVPTPDPTD